MGRSKAVVTCSKSKQGGLQEQRRRQSTLWVSKWVSEWVSKPLGTLSEASRDQKSDDVTSFWECEMQHEEGDKNAQGDKTLYSIRPMERSKHSKKWWRHFISRVRNATHRFLESRTLCKTCSRTLHEYWVLDDGRQPSEWVSQWVSEWKRTERSQILKFRFLSVK